MKEEQKKDDLKIDKKWLKNMKEQFAQKLNKIDSEEIFLMKKQKVLQERPPSEFGKSSVGEWPKTKTKKPAVKKSGQQVITGFKPSNQGDYNQFMAQLKNQKKTFK